MPCNNSSFASKAEPPPTNGTNEPDKIIRDRFRKSRKRSKRRRAFLPFSSVSFTVESKCRALEASTTKRTAEAWLIDMRRTDDKTAADYNLVAGDTLHLVLALRGGAQRNA